MRRFRNGLVLAAAAFITLASAARAEWAPDGIAVCTAAGVQESPRLTLDGAGGAIVVWEDLRTAVRNIYAQRLDYSGAPLWAADGVAVCPSTFNQLMAQVVSDGAGGAILVWEDIRHGVTNKDLYAQRLDAAGTPLWAAAGVAVSLAPGDQSRPKLIVDGAGGAIVAWTDPRNGATDIYAQRLDADGQLLWGTDGVPVCVADDIQGGVEMSADGFGGALVAWMDYRNTAVTGSDVYVQRLDAAGRPAWTVDGVPACNAVGNQSTPKVIADGAGGAVATWADDRDGGLDVYALRIGDSGTPLWSAGGVAVCAATGNQMNPDLTTDRDGGTILTWQDWRSGGSDIYAQRVDAAGSMQWTHDGVAVAATSRTEAFPTLVSFASGGTVIAWQETKANSETDVSAQRVSSSGSLASPTAIAVCAAPSNQGPPRVISDGAGEALIAWDDERSRSIDIYAQRLDDPTAITLLEFTAASSPDGVELAWQLADEAPFDLDSVHVQRAADATGPWIDLATLLPSPTMSFVDVTASTQASWYRLLLVGGAGMQASAALKVDASAVATRTILYPPVETADGIVIRYALAVGGEPRLDIFDVLGRRVRTLDLGPRPPGEHLTAWDRTTLAGTRAARGVYVVRLQSGRATTTQKLVLVR